jgi:hypothetical protein
MDGLIYIFLLCDGGKNLTCMHRSLSPQRPQVQQVYKCERRGECVWTTIKPEIKNQ